MTKFKVLLFLLALALVASSYYAWKTMPRVQHVGGETVASSDIKKHSQASVAENIRFDFSGGEQSKFRTPKRNLFGPLFFPPPQVKVVAKPVQPIAPVVVQAPPPPVIPVAPIPVVRVTMPPFKVLGFLKKGQQLTAFVALQGEVHLVKLGDTFAEDFKVVELNSKSITLGRISGAGEVSLPLDESSGTTGFQAPKTATPTTRVPVRIFRPENRVMNPSIRPGSRPSIPVVPPPIKGAN